MPLLPNLVESRAFDATRLRDYSACLRRSLYAHVYGLQKRISFELDLEFGKAMHAGFEALDRARVGGGAKDKWLKAALDAAWAASAHFPAEGEPGWDSKKNRRTLLRLFVWWAEQFADDLISVVRMTNGAPAVEVAFREKILGGAALLVCRPDAIVQLEPYNCFSLERKSTGSSVGAAYDSRWNPDIQISMQAIAGQSLLADSRFKFRGVILESAHVAVGHVKFSRAFCHRTDRQIAESKAEIIRLVERTLEWLSQLDMKAPPAANEAASDKCESACVLCRFKPICAADPGERGQIIARDFTVRAAGPWNPLHDDKVA